MKTLVIIRHAKSDQNGLFASDFERPLNKRGERDAPVMAERLKNKMTKIDAFVSSPAKRALSTCRLFCDSYGADKNKIIQVDELYHAARETFYDVVSGTDDRYNSIALFSHNPGITDFANSLCHGLYIDNMPTCAMLAVEANIESWQDFRTAEKKFLFFDYPKA
ncbi:MAG: histidine phosphatase family protein [Ferruginibacter sp.]